MQTTTRNWKLITVVLGFALLGTLLPIQETAGGPSQTILPGGRPARFRSYSVFGTGTITVIPNVEGAHGFVVTDIVTVADVGTTAETINLRQNGVLKLTYRTQAAAGSNTPHSYHFESGIVLTPDQPLIAECISNGSANITVTVSGYTF